MNSTPSDGLRFRALGLDTALDHVVYMNAGCHICRAEGYASLTRLVVSSGPRTLIATLNTVHGSLLDAGEVSLSRSAQRVLGVRDGDVLSFAHVPVLRSESFLRAKIYGQTLDAEAMRAIVADTVSGHLSDLHLTAFVTACAGERLSLTETVDLTAAMVAAGQRLQWDSSPVMDKHCVGGLPGNRTSPIVVAIATACGLTMPKTSSRAITSPAGTADTMEVLAPVDLDLAAIRRVVERCGGCVVWGGNMQLSPVDDILIRIERPLDIDSDGQMVASILSKKLAAGAQRVLIDLPVGPTAKVRDAAAAARLAGKLVVVGTHLGLQVETLVSDGRQPVGRGIGPALEARDLLQVFTGDAAAPADLRARSLQLAGRLLEMSGTAQPGAGWEMARSVLDSGAAWRQFQAICEAQGGMRRVPQARLTHPVVADSAGTVQSIDNRVLARIAKLAGAPLSPAAGVDLHVKLGDSVAAGQALYTIHAEAPGELKYAVGYALGRQSVIALEQNDG